MGFLYAKDKTDCNFLMDAVVYSRSKDIFEFVWKKIENLFDDKEEMIKLQGTFTKTPIAFTLACKFHVTITANAL